MARRRLDSGDDGDSSDRSGDDDGSDEEHGGGDCETDDALDPRKVCVFLCTLQYTIPAETGYIGTPYPWP